MQRRHFLGSVFAASAAVAAPRVAGALPMLDPFAPLPDRWRTFELTTSIQLKPAKGAAQAWIPVPSFTQATWTKPQASHWKTNATTVKLLHDAGSGTAMVFAAWPSSAAIPSIEIVGRVAARDRTTDFKKPPGAADLLGNDRLRYTTTAGAIVKDTAEAITAGAASEVDRARAVYEWVVKNTFVDPQIAGCGTGDAVAMLTAGRLGGKSADINGLFVALARAAGLPARVLYGIRVAPSAFGYTSLGANTPDVTREQHCRAEVFLTGFGWVPVDPADVRKVVLEEPPGHLALDNPLVTDAWTTLFGAWETNWVAYNDGHGVQLPGSSLAALAFLAYPQAEVAGERLDCLAPEGFRYAIAAREIT